MKGANKLFKETASYPEQALVLMFDLEEFSKFFSQPDVHTYVPKYLNHILECMEIIIAGGKAYWHEDEKEIYKPMPEPIHTKYLGDGMLYIWRYNDFSKEQLIRFVNRLWNLKISFDEVLVKCSEDVPVIDIPKKIRFGVSAGSIYKLTYKNSRKEEYIGYSINLASRLQNYCKELGFIFSRRVNLTKKDADQADYLEVVATKMRGFPNEIVYVDKTEYEELNPEIKKELFEELKK